MKNLQYTCDADIRDGTSTKTIPLDDYENKEFGRHESYDYYLNCLTRTRNKGLFTSNQNLKGDSAKYTRQDNQGNRYGFECPEERDYYPYWAYSPWKDIAVLTDYQDCEKIRSQNQNYTGQDFIQNSKRVNICKKSRKYKKLNKSQIT